MKKVLLFAVLALLCSAAFAQTYTVSQTFGCNQNVCNGIPVDGAPAGASHPWVTQFIEANQAFSLDVDIFIFGNPGNSGSGGMSNIVDDIPWPPRVNGARGADGTITFDWEAVNGNDQYRTLYYKGHAIYHGYRVEHFSRSPRGSGSYYAQLVLTSEAFPGDPTGQIIIDSVSTEPF